MDVGFLVSSNKSTPSESSDSLPWAESGWMFSTSSASAHHGLTAFVASCGYCGETVYLGFRKTVDRKIVITAVVDHWLSKHPGKFLKIQKRNE